MSIKTKRDVTRKGSISILFFYVAGLSEAVITGNVFHSNILAAVGLLIVFIGIGLTVAVDKKPIGWMGLTKERAL